VLGVLAFSVNVGISPYAEIGNLDEITLANFTK
jgi:hypothetical protein